MRIALYTGENKNSLTRFLELIEQMGYVYVENPDVTECFDIAVSYGGDGTFLSSVRKMGRCQIPILGINSGRLGFLANVAKEDAEKALKLIEQGSYVIEKRAMIKVDAENFPCDIPSRALNEFTIQKRGTTMINIEVMIDGQEVGKYWADGIIISTPTGSTAYSMSVGGAILTPECRNFIISPIAPHNLNIRPLVIADSSEIRLRIETRGVSEAIATVDNLEYDIQSGSVFELRRSKYELEVIKLPESSFYNTIREKLLWGVDPRN